jgi:amidase
MSTHERAGPDAASGITRREFGQLLGAAALSGSLTPFGEPVVDAGARGVDERTPPPDQGGAASELCFLTAVELATRIRRGDVSAREVMTAHLAQIERVNPKVNAIVTLVAEQAMAGAARADEATARRQPLGVLHGLPIAHKDLVDTAGIRTTRGSPFYRDNVPTRDAEIVARIKRAGAVTLGKTNTPEFGAGSNTFNPIFGATKNPYDVTKICGGSSGGAAVALACRMLPIADGSDTGGSLRNPAAFCNVVGFRPSPGRVATDATSWSPLSVSGPMARTVADAALFLSAIAGPTVRNPLAINEDGARYAASLDRDFRGTRVAWWRGLGGIPFEPEIRRVVDGNRAVFEQLGCVVEEAEPDFSGVDEAFATLRHLSYHTNYAAFARQRPDWLKDTIKWEIAEAERQTSADVARALARQSRMYAESAAFFERFEYFVLPVTQVAPFDVSIAYPTEIDSTPMRTYIDWMRSCWYVTFMANPAISVPGGFTNAGLPVGIQIVGRHRNEWSVLQLAHAFEQATGHGKRNPDVAQRS